MRRRNEIAVCAVLSLLIVAASAAGAQDGAGAVQAGGTEGTVRVNNLANLEALMNIFANVSEIYGIAAAPGYFFGAVAAFIKRQWILGGFLLSLVVISPILAIAMPGLINWLVASGRDAGNLEMGVVIVGVLALVTFAFTMVLTFIPSICAFKRNHSKKMLIFGLNFLAALPFLWPCAKKARGGIQ